MLSAILNKHPEVFSSTEYPLLLKEEFNPEGIESKCDYCGKSSKQVRDLLVKHGWGRMIEIIVDDHLDNNNW